ncbi:hypothetical protein [Vibrio mimicus]|uniref:Uncharacterized protein n=1 Tax=Vibrio mimicus TaxID=674 RepID=A0A2J9V3Y9_VIBMI|nr:hypothetical protein [Vibrio mimicus]PNM58463.1 hypothetical protein AL544_015690 [Vibrio mimicus]
MRKISGGYCRKAPLLLQTIYWCFAPIWSQISAHSRFVVAKLTFLSKRLVLSETEKELVI